jgi:hypothetical protein
MPDDFVMRKEVELAVLAGPISWRRNSQQEFGKVLFAGRLAKLERTSLYAALRRNESSATVSPGRA